MHAPSVQFLTRPTPAEASPGQAEGARPIVFGDNVWLGGGPIVCPGVGIGETVVGAGAVGSGPSSERGRRCFLARVVLSL